MDVEREPLDRLTLRLSHLPKILLVKKQGSQATYTAYWCGHRLGKIGRLRGSQSMWGWVREGSAEKGEANNRGKVLKELWEAWEAASGENPEKSIDSAG